jgi:3-deoxy-D-manno-octulosonic-acid transferase
MLRLYTFIIYCYSFGLHVASLFNTKAALWVNGRKNWKKKLASYKPTSKNIYWFHCASLGEFEQGRPLIDELKNRQKDCCIVLTFFSPSGYELRKNYSNANYVFYLPIDTPSNASYFIKTIKPTAAFFIKYEFWFNYLTELKTQQIKTYLVSGIFRPNHYFFKWYGQWALKKLAAFTTFFVQNSSSFNLLASYGYTNVVIAGDTRFDRVKTISQTPREIPVIERFKNNSLLVVAGSTWPEDEELLLELFNHTKKNSVDIKIIIAPHEVSQERIGDLVQYFGAHNAVKYSAINETTGHFPIIIIDNMGMLSSLYQYATICYIGGGFGKGIHNILEAAVYGKPVFFGPNFYKFMEAVELIQNGGAFSVKTNKKMTQKVNQLMTDNNYYKQCAEASYNYVHQNTGATNLIATHILNDE